MRLARHLFELGTTAPPGKELRVGGVQRPDHGRAPGRVGAVVRARVGRARWASAVWQSVALGRVRPRLRRRRRLRGVGPRRVGGRRAARAGRRAAGCRCTSARPCRRPTSSAASGSTRPAGWRGWRTTPPPPRERADLPVPDRLRRRHPARARVVPLPGDRPARARGRRPHAAGRRGGRRRRRERRRQVDARQAAVPVLRADRGPHPRRRRRPGAGAGRRSGGRAARARSRTSSASSCPPVTRSASATCPASTTGRRSRRPWTGPARATSSTKLPAGLDTQLGPTWRDGVEVSFGQWQKLALARGLHARRPAAARARRADRRPRRRDRARPLRALRGDGPARRRRRATAASPCSSPTGSRPCAWPTSSSCSTAPASSSSAPTTSSWPRAASTPSSTTSRPPPTADPNPNPRCLEEMAHRIRYAISSRLRWASVADAAGHERGADGDEGEDGELEAQAPPGDGDVGVVGSGVGAGPADVAAGRADGDEARRRRSWPA